MQYHIHTVVQGRGEGVVRYEGTSTQAIREFVTLPYFE